MMNRKILEILQLYGNAAFLQGYEAKQNNIQLNERSKLAKMEIAFLRLKLFEIIAEAVSIDHY